MRRIMIRRRRRLMMRGKMRRSNGEGVMIKQWI